MAESNGLFLIGKLAAEERATLASIRELGREAGAGWLDSDLFDRNHCVAVAAFDAASPEYREQIQAAWSAGWREGFGPVAAQELAKA
jgi:hypothetical protein